MHFPLKQTDYVARFVCLGPTCEDTCCQGWGMQVDEKTFRKYEAEKPELLAAVTSGESEHVMRRDAETDFCVKLTEGLCSIHRDYGSDFLGDACHFYPRITRQVGGQAIMTAALSCPEAARLALFGKDPFAWKDHVANRLPEALRHYARESVTPERMLRIHDACVSIAGDSNAPPEHVISRLLVIAQSLDHLPPENWLEAIPFYCTSADANMPPADYAEYDAFNLLHALLALIHTARRSPRTRLRRVVDNMKEMLRVTFDEATAQLSLTVESVAAYSNLQQRWYAEAAITIAPVLQRYLQAQLSIHFFPFSGLGETNFQRMQMIALRFATVKLALMAVYAKIGMPLSTQHIIDVIQPLSRFLDHLADAKLSLSFYNEAGWGNFSRLRGVLED